MMNELVHCHDEKEHSFCQICSCAFDISIQPVKFTTCFRTIIHECIVNFSNYNIGCV